MTPDRQERLEKALQSAIMAKNPVLCASIRAALREEPYDPLEGLLDGLHPEVRHVLDWGDEKPTPPPTP